MSFGLASLVVGIILLDGNRMFVLVMVDVTAVIGSVCLFQARPSPVFTCRVLSVQTKLRMLVN